MTGGNWHHGELSIDQALMMRPFPGSTQYTGSVEGLYLCGAGSHPGGSLMGLAGKNAAEEILKQGSIMSAAERKTMLLTTPFHSRVEQYCELNDWGAWQGIHHAELLLRCGARVP